LSEVTAVSLLLLRYTWWKWVKWCYCDFNWHKSLLWSLGDSWVSCPNYLEYGRFVSFGWLL